MMNQRPGMFPGAGHVSQLGLQEGNEEGWDGKMHAAGGNVAVKMFSNELIMREFPDSQRFCLKSRSIVEAC